MSVLAFAAEQPVALADPPADAAPGATRIEVDEPAGAIRIIIAGEERAVFNGLGLSVVGSIDYTGSITDLSDLRRKTDIRSINDELPKLDVLKPVSFRMKDDPLAQVEYGLIAQQVEEIYPALVENRTDDMKAVNYVGLIAPLIAAVQQLHAENRALSNRIEALERGAELIQADGLAP